MAAFVALTAMPAESVAPEASGTVESAYPGLASGVLTYARLGDLPGSTVLRSGRVEITADEVNSEILRAPEALRDELRKNGFFLLEQMATSNLLMQVAKEHADRTGGNLSQNSEKEIMRSYLRRIAENVQVTEADVREFYQQNKDMFGGAKLDQVRKQLHQYMLHQKREQTVSEHIRTLGQVATRQPKMACLDCHTPEKSTGFAGHEEEYMQKIVHWREPAADRDVKE